MSLKAELEIWAAALTAYDAENFEEAVELFSRIADSSKIYTNMGLIYATVGDHESAVQQFLAANQLDQYHAVAYFQRGVSNFLLGRYEIAIRDFEDALNYLRGNQSINYEQLGLKFVLFSAEVLFNRGLALIYLGRMEQGLMSMQDARKEKKVDEHAVIDEAIQDRGEGYTVFSIPVGVLYRPSENKIKNAKTKDYLGKAKLVATDDINDTFTAFTGATRLKQGLSPQGVVVDDLQISSPDLSRSVTYSAPNTASDPTSSLQRSKTTLESSKQRVRPLILPIEERPTTGPIRGLSLRRQNSTPDVRRANTTGNKSPAPRMPQSAVSESRPTDFYDDYINSYRDAEPRVPPVPKTKSPDRPPPPPVANLARSNTTANTNNIALSRTPSRAGLSSSASSIKRKHTRSNTLPLKLRSARNSPYEEEEGYASGDHDEGSLIYDLAKIRIKVHYNDEIRGMAITPDVLFEEFMDKLTAKFGLAVYMLDVKFTDEDGGMVSLKDESDFEMAIETAKESAKGKSEGKLEIWCTEVKLAR